MRELTTDYQQFIATGKYARWLEEEKRRETWTETVDRYITFFMERPSGTVIADDIWSELRDSILNLEVMPSMRCLMTAGKALDRDNVAGYNCAYRAIDDIRAFDEMMYVLMCGTGVGFSVERQFISKLPELPEELYETDVVITVRDSKLGWATAYKQLVALLYAGSIPKWDTSGVRPAGARLKTFGGRASGPEPLEDLFQFTIEVFINAKGRRLTSVECHDVACKIADIVVVGGVRRSALISLSNLTDERMRNAKSGRWWEANKQRELANNSVCYTERPDMGIFLREWESLYASKSGERGIFSRPAAQRIAERNGRRDSSFDFGTNPCSEIILRSQQFCNLSEIIARKDDSLADLKRKARVAAILGTLQSTLTDFRYLSTKWKVNTVEERLLGVSITGIMDHPVLSGQARREDGGFPALPQLLEQLKEIVLETNKEYAGLLGIEPSTAATCNKPSGTVSQLVDSASGIHPRYSNFYIRTVRADKKDPLYNFLLEKGVPCEDEVGKEGSSAVFSFPIASPEGCVVRDDVSALDQLELWKVYAEYWCEHKPSITVYVREDEWLQVGAWVYKNFDIVSGVSFLPHSDHIYKQAPYQEITKEAYDEAIDAFPKDIDWSELSSYETEDNVRMEHELACTGNSCELA